MKCGQISSQALGQASQGPFRTLTELRGKLGLIIGVSGLALE